jgi:alpha-glucosidase (family GH31 glycosyl hydrolase)
VTITALKDAYLKVNMTLYKPEHYDPYMPENVFVSDQAEDMTAVLSDMITITTGGTDSKTKTFTPYSLQVKSKFDKTTVVWDSAEHALYLSQYFMTWGTSLMSMPKPNFHGAFGLGERVDDYFLKEGTYSFWNRDSPNNMENGLLPGKNNYGTHPFFAWQSPTGTFVSNYFNNAAANDVIISNDEKGGKIHFDYISVGGSFDLFINEEQTPDDLVAAYQTLVGKPVLPSEWILGFNQCRYGYHTLDVLEEVVTNYTNAGIPLDTIWNDIDYLDNYSDFTVDQSRYSGLGAYVKTLHTKGMHYIPIIDAGITSKPDGDYEMYNTGVKDGVFIMDYTNKTPFVGQVWPGDAVFVDWTHDKAAAYWQGGIDMLSKEVDFDGLWLDMNEASNFCNGACYADQVATDPIKYKATYWPTGRDLDIKSLDLDAMHSDGRTELEHHNMYALGEVKATHEWFVAQKKRTAIISRSSFAGQGKYGSRWLGDNFSNAQNMGLSVTGTMMMNMFGIPLIGADICGFIGESSPELCARWTKLGAFYPFARNHNDLTSASQEPYQPRFDVAYPDAQVENTTYSMIIKDAIMERYNLIPYLYSNMHEVSRDGGTYFKPLFFNYPMDTNAFRDMYYNFMIGDDLKISMVTNSTGMTTADFYFPKGNFCPLFNFEDDCINQNTIDDNTGSYQPLPASADVSHIHTIAGSIVATANSTMNKIMNVKDLKTFPTDLHISPQQQQPGNETFGWKAFQNKFFTDDGDNFDAMDLTMGTVNVYQFYAEGGHEGSSRFEIQFSLKTNATMHYNKDTMCTETSMNDYLGDIYVHNAPFYGVDETDYMVFLTYTDGTQVPSDKDKTQIEASYVGGMDGNSKGRVLKLAKLGEKGVCMNRVKSITVLKSIVKEEKELEFTQE